MDFMAVLRTFMKRALRTNTDLARLSGISLHTLEHWTAGTVRRPRYVTDVLKIACALRLDTSDTSTLLTAAGHPTLSVLQAQAQRSSDRALTALLTFWEHSEAEPAPAPRVPSSLAARYQLRPPVADFVGRRHEVTQLILGHLGNTYINLGDARSAIPYQEQHLAVARALGDPCAEGRALGFLGMAYTDLGDAGGAISYYQQALIIFRAVRDQRNEGYALHYLGIAYLQLGEVGRAIECCQGSHTIACAIGERRLEGYALSNLAHAEARRGKMLCAARAFEQAVALFHDVGDRHGEAECQWRVGLVLAQQGARAEALPLLRTALAYQQEIGHMKAAEHAALLARLEASADLPPALHIPTDQRAVGADQDASMEDDAQP